MPQSVPPAQSCQTTRPIKQLPPKKSQNRRDHLFGRRSRVPFLWAYYHHALATDALQRIKQIRWRRYKYALARSLALPGYPNGTPFPDRN